MCLRYLSFDATALPPRPKLAIATAQDQAQSATYIIALIDELSSYKVMG